MPGKSIKAYFEVKNNELIYYPPDVSSSKLPHTLRLEGKWKFSNGTLVFGLNESYNKIFGQSVRFLAKLEKTSKNYISFSVLKGTTPKLRSRSSLELTGKWKVDALANIIFEVKRNNSFDELSFGNNWQVTKENNILLLYKRRFFKKEIINSIVISGGWSLGKNTLDFMVDGSDKNKIKFDIALTNKAITFNKDKIGLTLGLKKDYEKQIFLYGRCKYLKDKFEVALNPDKQERTWVFKLNKHLSDDKELVFELINAKNKPLGLNVSFSKKLSSNVSLFLSAKLGKEKRIEAGLYLPF